MSRPPASRAVHLVSGELADVPADDEWLSAAERAALTTLRVPKRRAEWRLGRWLAKRAVAAATGVPPALLEVLAAADGAPEVHGPSEAVALSISHRHGRGLAAAAIGPEPIGCDLELIEPRSERFVRDWLTERESAQVVAAAEALRPLLANLCWSGKESASKVLRVGLRFDTRSFDVELPGLAACQADRTGAWQPLAVGALRHDARFTGAWRVRRGFVETLVGAAPFDILEPTA